MWFNNIDIGTSQRHAPAMTNKDRSREPLARVQIITKYSNNFPNLAP